MGDGNSYCMQLFRDAEGGCNEVTRCDWLPAERSTFDLLQGKYGMNMVEYYVSALHPPPGTFPLQPSLTTSSCFSQKQAYLCAKDSEDHKPDVVALPTDESLPLCFYNIPAQKMKITSQCNGRCDVTKREQTLSDF